MHCIDQLDNGGTMPWLSIALTTLLLGACVMPAELNEASPYFIIPAGSRLILNTELEIPPHRTTLFLQHGQVLPYSQVNQYYPHCVFEVWALSDQARIVRPDVFLIHKVRQDILLSLIRRHKTLGLVPVSDDAPVSHRVYANLIYLKSDRQPDVYRLICQQLEDVASLPRHVTLSEIRASLGTVFSLRLAGSATR